MKHIDNLFKEKLYNHEASVPEGMWEKIAPIAEEESGRALLWFWFAGALALVIGGYGIYKMINTNSPSDSGTLALEHQISNQTSQQTFNSLTASAEKTNITPNDVADSNSETSSTEQASNLRPAKSESKLVAAKKVKKQTGKAKTNSNKPSTAEPQKVNNTVESITNVVGVPANLVITKSYINKEGSIIKQSNLTAESGNAGPQYDIIINSEAKDLNAGALLRIVEPLENIPLPSFGKELKKKTLVANF